MRLTGVVGSTLFGGPVVRLAIHALCLELLLRVVVRDDERPQPEQQGDSDRRSNTNPGSACELLLHAHREAETGEQGKHQ
jgi:hypothetical protein